MLIQSASANLTLNQVAELRQEEKAKVEQEEESNEAEAAEVFANFHVGEGSLKDEIVLRR